MTKTELNKFRLALNAKNAELQQALRRRDGITIETTPDALDETQLAAARELTTRGLERESKQLRDVRAALTRLDAGAYGTCLDCEEEISQRRLQALPWAPLCIGCQERADRDGQRGSVSEDRFLREAA